MSKPFRSRGTNNNYMGGAGSGKKTGAARLKLLKGKYASTSWTFRNAEEVDEGRLNRNGNLRKICRRTV
jgi:hypothetical protein